MKHLLNIIIVLLLSFFASCSGVKLSSKRDFANGFYSQKINKKKQNVYVVLQDDVLVIYPVVSENHKQLVDTAATHQFYQKEMMGDVSETILFKKNSYDIDFLTIPLKYRPKVASVPQQLNANLNGAIYLGFRTDNFKVQYFKNPLKKSVRQINHYGLSIGVFTGLGSTAMTPTTTNSAIAIEYDGLIWNKGIAGIIAVNNFTVGLSVGFDDLMDSNKKYWTYQAKPWLGLAFGLNLN